MMTKEQLLKYVTVCPCQGYALYWEEDGQAREWYSGTETLDGGVPIGGGSNFRLASVSKQFIGHGVRVLERRGLLRCDSTLGELWTGLPEYMRPVTVLDLLNHVSGLRDYDGEENTLHADRQLVDADVLEFLLAQKDGYTPHGTVYRYSNTAYVLLGLLIERLSGEPIEDFMRANVFRPFGMEHTEINRQGVSVIENRVYGTAWEDGRLVPRDQGHTSATIGDGAVYSSLRDLRAYLAAFERLDLGELYRARSVTGDGDWYSRGVHITPMAGHTLWHHTGSTCGTNNFMGTIPSLGIRVIFLSNIDGLDASRMRMSLREYLEGK